MEHAKTVEALNHSEAERGAVEHKLEAALREKEDAGAALVRSAMTLLANAFLHHAQRTITVGTTSNILDL